MIKIKLVPCITKKLTATDNSWLLVVALVSSKQYTLINDKPSVKFFLLFSYAAYIASPAHLTCWHEIDDQSRVSNVTTPRLTPTDRHTDIRVSTANSVWRRRKETSLKFICYKGFRKYTIELYWPTESIKKTLKKRQYSTLTCNGPLHWSKRVFIIETWLEYQSQRVYFLSSNAILWIFFYKHVCMSEFS